MLIVNHTTDRLLLRFAWVTVVLLYMTVLAGSVVRATGSGMGCPDWPTCFGRLIPPTELSQLPPDYKERFRKPGFEIADFNPVHTWVEYLNRLIGAMSGISMLITALLAFLNRRRYPSLPWLLIASLMIFGVVSWMGRVVVDTNLAPWNITLHMLGALVLVGAAVVALVQVSGGTRGRSRTPIGRGIRLLLHALLIAGLVQIILGTRVREEIDLIANSLEDCCRDQWIGKLSLVLTAHRAGAWLVVVLGFITWLGLRSCRVRWAWLIPAVLGANYLAGVILLEYHVPAAMQPVHMFLAAVFFGVTVGLLAATRSGDPSLLKDSVPAGTGIPPVP